MLQNIIMIMANKWPRKNILKNFVIFESIHNGG